MRTGVRFSEEYTNPAAEVRVMERYMGWRPQKEGDELHGMYEYLTTMEADTLHGGPSSTDPPTPTCWDGVCRTRRARGWPTSSHI